MGVKSHRKIANSSFTASSWKPGYYPYAARLEMSVANGSWCAARHEVGEYLEIDLGRQLFVAKIAVQGDSVQSYGVTSFSISYSKYGAQWENYMIHGDVQVRAKNYEEKFSVKDPLKNCERFDPRRHFIIRLRMIVLLSAVLDRSADSSD